MERRADARAGCTSPAYLRRARNACVDATPGADARARAAGARARHAGLRRDSSPPHARECARRSPRRSASSRATRFVYALCRPPGHHAGPGWLGGYCYLNNAAAAAQALREAAARRSGSSTSTCTIPTAPRRWSRAMAGRQPALAARAAGRELAVAQSARPRTEREQLVAFSGDPPSRRLPRCARRFDCDALARRAPR